MSSLKDRYLKTVTSHRNYTVRLLAALAHSNRDFETIVRSAYSVGDLDHPAEQDQKERAKLKRYEEIEAKLRALGQPEGLHYERTVNLFKNDIAFWTEPSKFQPARDHFQQVLDDLRSRMDDRRNRGQLSRFLVDPKVVKYLLAPSVFAALQ